MGEQKRKGKKRAAPKVRPEIDEDLHTLASVIAEYQLDDNAYGWFRPPWRNGAEAAKLAAEVAFSPGVFDGVGRPEEKEAAQLVVYGTWSSATPPPSDAYEHAGRLYTFFVQSKMNTNTARLLGAALRCMQLKLARSDGGGAVYNEILIPMFLPLEPRAVADLMLEHRCRDSIGTTAHLQGDRNDRQRSAFRIAWERGLYLAAYAIPRAF